MATKIPRVIADLELQLATALAVGGESFTLSSATDDDGEALPAGIYVFAVDSGTSNKEYLLGQVNGTAVTSVKSVSRQGVQTTGAARAHRVGSPIILTNFAALQLVADTLRGAVDLDGATPLAYDAEPTLSDREELATVGYVLDTVTGGTVTFDSQTIAGTAGATISAGNLVYFDESDQEWKLCDADTAATVEGVMRGIALGSGTDGGAITGGVLLGGSWTTTGLTAGAVYYASNTAGALATSAGTTKHIVGVALSTTRLWVIPQHRETIPTRTKDALAAFNSTPSSSNPFITKTDLGDPTLLPPQVVVFTSSGTWTKDTGLKYVVVEVVGGGGGGAAGSFEGGGGAGGYSRKTILASILGATETVTVGAGGATEVAGSNSSFGSHCTGNGGGTTTTQAGAPGGSATGGDVNFNGGSGTWGGENGSGSPDFNGTGGSSYFGTGTNSGAGGNNNSAGQTGIVIVTEYYS